MTFRPSSSNLHEMFQFSLFSQKNYGEHKVWLQSLNLQVKRRAYQKTITLRVDREGAVRVGCAKSCPKKEIENFLIKNRNWIEQSLRQVAEHQKSFPKKRFFAGEEYLFLGQRLQLEHQVTHLKRPKFYFHDERLILNLGAAQYEPTRIDQYGKAMQSFYKSAGTTLLKSLVQKNAEQMQLRPNRLSFRSQKSRWGSCSSEGNVSLNWRLVCAPARVANYVVVHELAHLRHHDHSARFWALVERYCPEYKACKSWLNKNQFEFDFLHL
jgi:predicted metal-dependent hydrolase